MLSESLKTLSIANIFEKLHQVKVLFHCGTIKWLTIGLIPLAYCIGTECLITAIICVPV